MNVTDCVLGCLDARVRLSHVRSGEDMYPSIGVTCTWGSEACSPCAAAKESLSMPTASIAKSLLDQERRRERALPSLLDEGDAALHAHAMRALVIKWEGEGH